MRHPIAVMLTTAALAAPAAAPAQDLTEDDVKRLALEAILENPEVVMEAVGILQAREAEAQAAGARATLEESRELLERDPNAPVLGNPDGSVTMVEFFDYNCPYCRRAGDEVAALLEADDDVRVVYREWPILGDGSVFAARAALAAREQGAYEAMHAALMGARARLDEEAVMRIAGEVGLDADRLRADMDAPAVQEHIDASMGLAQALGFSGTPSFVIGGELVPGLVDSDRMEALVDAAREAAE